MEENIVNRFDVKTESKLLTKINKLFINMYSITEEEAINKEIRVMDPANVCQITGKTEEAKRILSRFYIKDSSNKEHELNYISDSLVKCSYSNIYLLRALDILNCVYDTTTIFMKKDYPITLENKHFKIIIAPRASEE